MSARDDQSAKVPTFGEIAERLSAHGYRPLPIAPGTKKPPKGFMDWPNYIFQLGDEQRRDLHSCYTGILTGHGYVAVDVDVYHAEPTAALEQLLQRELGTAPRRVGQAPKCAYLFRVAADMPYLATRKFRMPNDPVGSDGKRKLNRVEVLTKDKQLVAYGVHPDTGSSYSWNRAGEPLLIPVTQLPEVTESQIRQFITAAGVLLGEFGEVVQGRALDPSIADHRESSSLGQRARNPEQFRAALAFLPNDYERDDWIKLAHSIKAGLGPEGWQEFEAWCEKSESYTGRDTQRVWDSLDPKQSTAGTLLHEARARGWKENISVEDFYAYLPTHQYIFIPTREMWPGVSVNTRSAPPRNADGTRATKPVAKKKRNGETEWSAAPIGPAEWLDVHRSVEQMTWAPGEGMVIAGRLMAEGGWVERAGCSTFNLYRPPAVTAGDPTQAGRWREHLRKVFPADAEHIERFLAHRVQRPGEKINHALLLGGGQSIGKDTLLDPVKHAVGPWNFVEVSPRHFKEPFNGFVKSVILRVSEAHDLGEIDRYAFYELLKTYIAAPPDVLRCNEKHLRAHAVLNVTAVILTTNYKTGGIYLPSDDRRHYVAWSELTKAEFSEDYWRSIWGWYHQGGIAHVAAWLTTLDLSNFDPKAPPPKTPAWWAIVDSNRAPEDAQLADVLDDLGNPAAVTKADLWAEANGKFADIAVWLQDRRNARQLPHRMESCGYVPCRNEGNARDGLWKVAGAWAAIYVKRELTLGKQIEAAQGLVKKRRAADEKFVKQVVAGGEGADSGDGSDPSRGPVGR